MECQWVSYSDRFPCTPKHKHGVRWRPTE